MISREYEWDRAKKKAGKRGRARKEGEGSKRENTVVYGRVPSNTALPSVDEGLLALSRNQVVPGGTRKGEEKKGTTDGKNGQWTNERTPCIVYSHATNWDTSGTRTRTRTYVRILLFDPGHGK